MDLSVIVPTRNRANNLNKFFESLLNQTLSLRRFEVIVIDNGSTDDTREVCEEWKNKIENLRYIYNANPGLHIGRNNGYQQSVSEILVFADDDIIAMPTWLEAIYDGFIRRHDVVLIGGNDIPKFEVNPPKWVEELWITNNNIKMLLDYSCIIMGEEEREINPYYVFGCNFAIRKSVLNITQGFHPDGMPDELLCYRGDGESYVSKWILQNKLKTLFIPKASVYHVVSEKRLNLEYLKRIAYRNGISMAYTLLRDRNFIILQREIWKNKLRIKFMNKEKNAVYLLKESEKIEGMQFLFAQYKKYKKIRKWVKMDNYLGKKGVIFVEEKDC